MYIDIVTTLKDIADTVNPTGYFYHGRISDANLAIDQKGLFPQIHLYPFKISHPRNNQGLDNCDILMAFIMQDSPHTSDEDRTLIIEQADILSRKFELLMQTNDLEYSNFATEPFFKQFSGVTSGMFVRFNLQMKSKICEI